MSQRYYSKTPFYRAPIYRVPQFTGDSPFLQNEALCVNQCELQPDLLGPSISSRLRSDFILAYQGKFKAFFRSEQPKLAY